VSPDPCGFQPPPYPYARLAVLAETASRHEGGLVDLSIGTPCDPAPRAVVEAMGRSGAEHGYPASLGSMELRSSASRWIERRFGVTVDVSQIAACVGTKEFVASAAWFLHLRDPSRNVVVAPAVAYPTYAMSARLARCDVFSPAVTEDGASDLSSVPPDVAERALMLWVNTPSNPTGGLSDLGDAAAWGRSHGVPVFSDECYCEFTWEPERPATILEHGPEGVLAVHSLSKRSNMAGMRVGFYAGDAELVSYLSSVRQHAGLMVPGPVQRAATVALDDDEHVELQRTRYKRRLEKLAEAFDAAGIDVELPKGGFYLWVPVPDWAAAEAGGGSPVDARGAWVFAEALAESAGALVSPGDLYGIEGSGFVRVAVVQPDDKIDLVARRLLSSSHPHLTARIGRKPATLR
jgi:succinyldiaminopimelate transaminase